MKIDLKRTRAILDITVAEAAQAAGISDSFYKQYESKGEIPCKYVYNLWKKYNNYPLPDDFFCYTSYTLRANMTFSRLSQTKIAEIFGYSSQGVMSRILSVNIPMYEMKSIFIKTFDPLVIPMIKKTDGRLAYMTDLVPKGNFMNRMKEEQDDSAEISDKDIKTIIVEEKKG